MLQLVIVGVGVLVLISLVVQVVAMRRKVTVDLAPVQATIGGVKDANERVERTVREEIARHREESAHASRDARAELAGAVRETNDSLAQRFEALRATLDERLRGLQDESTRRLDGMRVEASAANKQAREEQALGLKTVADSLLALLGELGADQRRRLDAVTVQLEKLTAANQLKGEELKVAVEHRLQALQEDNAKQLEQMRATVDEKLQGTLEKRLGESFELVRKQLDQVARGLGEMQSLAHGVGDLKKVLSNVKTRGTWGEVQLGSLLEQVLSPNQYAANVSPKQNAERVEFAIKMPGRGGDLDEVVWLPIDAKFPIEDYQRLLEAQDQADVAAIEVAGRQLEARMRQCAKDIADKYIAPPQTTDFAILFLPIEGLFSEVLRRNALAEQLQRDYRVVIAGPTTLWSILTSLQMGFRTLAIEKQSSEVWHVLGAVKTEWEKYGKVLDKLKKQLQTASNTVDDVGTRTRAIGRKLRTVEELPAADAARLLALPSRADEQSDDVDDVELATA